VISRKYDEIEVLWPTERGIPYRLAAVRALGKRSRGEGLYLKEQNSTEEKVGEAYDKLAMVGEKHEHEANHGSLRRERGVAA
jgi:hypothetical protein